nr:four-domain proteases inhibitor-like [Cherax quadricarinatus]
MYSPAWLVDWLVFKTSLSPSACGQDNCNSVCTADYRPVCCTDGITYPNNCTLELADCQSDEDIAVMSTFLGLERFRIQREICDLVLSALHEVQPRNLRAYIGECTTYTNACDLVWMPVCGTDNVTCANLCQLELADCLSDEDITEAYPGECQEALHKESASSRD